MRTIWIMLVMLAQQAHACELLVKAVSHTHPNAEKDRVGAYKAGMVVNVMPDGHPWGKEERLPKFVLIKIPMVPVEKLEQYAVPQVESGTHMVRRREWMIRVADMPLAVRNKLAKDGELTIKSTDAYTGPFDYTWEQVKGYFRNQRTGLDEGRNL